jgi:transcription antitermination factor NusG
MLPTNPTTAVEGNRSWYVARTKRRQERQAAVVLGLREIEHYLPMAKPTRPTTRSTTRPTMWPVSGLATGSVTGSVTAPTTSPRGRACEPSQLEPYFPCYLFVKLDLERELRRVRYSPGITDLLGGDEGPTPLSDELIESIRRRLVALAEERARPRFERGERVLIASGPLEGLEAVFDRRLTAQGRSEVLVEFVNRLVRARVDESELRHPRSEPR